MGLHKLLYTLHRAYKLSVQKDSESDISTSLTLASTWKQVVNKIASKTKIARVKQSLLKSTPLKVMILSSFFHQEANHLSLIMLESHLASRSKEVRLQAFLSQLSFWNRLPLAIVLRSQKTLSTWAKQCFQAKALPTVQHKKANGFVQ